MFLFSLKKIQICIINLKIVNINFNYNTKLFFSFIIN